MENSFDLIFTLLSSFGLAYLVLISVYTYGWFQLKTPEEPKTEAKNFWSILIAMRNEEERISECLKSLLKLNYPKELFEIILVDDHSEDRSGEIIQTFIRNNPVHNISLIELGDEEQGKKFAISKAVEKSRGSMMLMTDADCTMNPEWLMQMENFYNKTSAKLISGPVVFKDERNVFSKLQSLEFLSLIASGAGSIGIHAPIMCNGANLAFSKEAFYQVNAYESNDQYMSGDDVFLMLKIRKHFGNNAVQFLKSREAIVITQAKKSFKAFVQQRIRWVSKSRAYTNLGLITASLIIYLFNYLLFAGFIASIFIPELFITTLVFLLIKAIIDLPLLLLITSFTQKRKLMIYFLPLQVLYFIYISIIGFAGNLVKFSWKGRKGR